MVLVDSSALIPLLRIGRLNLLKSFFKKIVITEQVYREIEEEKTGFSEVKKACDAWIIIKNVERKEEIEEISNSEGIEIADASLILLAQQQKDILLLNDYGLIKVARAKGIECWWLTKFIIKCVIKKIIKKEEAKKILYGLVQKSMRLDSVVYSAILNEIERLD